MIHQMVVLQQQMFDGLSEEFVNILLMSIMVMDIPLLKFYC